MTSFLITLFAAGEPAGGAPVQDLVPAALVAAVTTAAVLLVGFGHRTGRITILSRTASLSEHVIPVPGWAIPLGGALLLLCGGLAMIGFPLDDVWHRIFGQDVTLWGPTHVLMIGGASLAPIAAWLLLVEGRCAAGKPEAGRLRLLGWEVQLAGAALVG